MALFDNHRRQFHPITAHNLARLCLVGAGWGDPCSKNKINMIINNSTDNLHYINKIQNLQSKKYQSTSNFTTSPDVLDVP